MTKDTSLAALESIDQSHLMRIVRDAIHTFGTDGAISDQVREYFEPLRLSYSSVTARYAKLEEYGYIVRGPDKRPGKSGRSQLVMRTSENCIPKV